MEKQYLVTISNDIDHLFGVKFICSFFNEMSESRITLLHICRRDSSDLNKVLLEKWQGPANNIQGHLTVGARRSIQKAQDLLKERKMPVGQIFAKTVEERFGKVKDILAEGSKGLYDAIVLGRRASYSLQWMFERSADETTQAMIKDSNCTSPLWICPDPEPGRKNVLLCLDGYENAYRAADHVGYILSAEKQHTISLFHVAGGSGMEAEKVFQSAETILKSHNVGTERIKRNATRKGSVAKSILGEIDKGRFAVVALGMRGKEQSLLRGLSLAGSTTLKILSKLEKVSLWCCP